MFLYMDWIWQHSFFSIAQKLKEFVKEFVSKYEQIHSFLWICLQKSFTSYFVEWSLYIPIFSSYRGI